MSGTVLLLGATGRTGRLVLSQLLERGIRVKAIVRSADRLPAELSDHERLAVVEADLLALSDDYVRALVSDCQAVISCLGHTATFQGMYGSPRDLVTRSVARICAALDALGPQHPVRFILMSSVSVNRPARRDARRGAFERATVALLRGVVPLARDNQRAADLLSRRPDPGRPSVEWVAVRPDTLVDDSGASYTLHEGLVNSLFAPARTSRANVAHFMCELSQDAALWADWRSRSPVIVDAGARGAARP
jgi:nucleoside-diphosphate-sugar epimerase